MTAADDFALFITAQAAVTALWLSLRHRAAQRQADRRAAAAKEVTR